MSKAAKRERQRQNREVRREIEAQIARRQRTFKTARRAVIAAVVAAAVILIFFTGGSGSSKPATKPIKRTYASAPTLTIDPAKTYVATVDTTEGSFEMRLDVEHAPVTVNSFVFLADHKFYDGLLFHRIVKDFVAQGGDPNGDGSGGPGYKLPDEPPVNGYVQYSVAMANSGTAGTSGSQFFVVSTPAGATTLNAKGAPYTYSSLGTVTSGFDTIAKLDALGASVDAPLTAQQPTKRVRIKRIRITVSAATDATTTTTAAAATTTTTAAK